MSTREDQDNTSPRELIHAYDRMLKRAEDTLSAATSRSETTLKHALHAATDKAVELGELTREEAGRVHGFVTRDLYDVGRHLAIEERDVADWLRLNLLLVEKEVLHRFSALAQAAKLELKHLEKAKRRLDEWHTGEVTTIGTLRCRSCGKLVHFENTGHIPPCPKCRATIYERAKGSQS